MTTKLEDDVSVIVIRFDEPVKDESRESASEGANL